MTSLTTLRSLFAAGLVAVSIGALPNLAEAKTKIGIYFGVPFYDSAVEDGYLYEPGYGWYAPEYRPTFRRHHSPNRVSCGAAARELRNDGFRRVVALECDGRTYTFQARKAGRILKISYSARTGDYWRI
jgi:hypothetical protein